MPHSRQHEEGPTLARFLRENVSIEDRRDCPLDFFTPGTASRHRVRQRMPHGCGLLEAREPLSFPCAIGPTDETPPETSLPTYGKAYSPPPSPKQKGRSLFGSVPCSLLCLFPPFLPAGAHWGKMKTGRNSPLSCAGQGGSCENIASTTWAARWGRRTSSRSAGGRWRSGPWRR